MQKYKVYINNSLEIITENWESFCANYIVVKAAGGIVYNTNNQILMIFRNGIWDLPKGKLESREDIEQCAIREVEEETGVSGLIIQHKVEETYHTYMINNKRILKRTYWYIMHANLCNNLVPQTNEGITKVCWVDNDKVSEKLIHSFENIKELLKLVI